MGTRRIHERRALFPAFRQGGLDGLCGLYAAINAIRLVGASAKPLNPAGIASLFECGAEWLNDQGLLVEAVTDGMEEDVQYALTRRVAEDAEAMIDASLSVTRPITPAKRFQRQRVLAAIDASLAQGAVLIVCLEGTYSHYTVFAGRSDTRYHLHDSDDMRWIERRSLGVLSARSRKRHQVPEHGVVQVALR